MLGPTPEVGSVHAQAGSLAAPAHRLEGRIVALIAVSLVLAGLLLIALVAMG